MPDGMNVLGRSLERQSQLRQTLLGILAQQQSQQKRQAFTQQQQQTQRQFLTQQTERREELRRESPDVKLRMEESRIRIAEIERKQGISETEQESLLRFQGQQKGFAEQTDDPIIKQALLSASNVARASDIPNALYAVSNAYLRSSTLSAQKMARTAKNEQLLMGIQGELRDDINDFIGSVADSPLLGRMTGISSKLRKIASAIINNDTELYNTERDWIQQNPELVDELLGIFRTHSGSIKKLSGEGFPVVSQAQQTMQESQQQDLLQKGLGALRTEDQVPQAIEQQPQAEGFGGPRVTLKPVFESIGRITGEQEPEELSPFERFIRRGGIFGGKSKNINTESSILPITTKAQSISKESKIGNVKQQFNNATQLIKEWYGDTAILQHTGKDTAQRFEQLKNDFKKFAPSLNLEEFITSMFGSK